MRKKNKIGQVIKVILGLIAALVVIAAAYVAYVFVSYHRLPDKQPLTVQGSQEEPVRTDTPYRLLSFNIGFGAYEPDFSFFMDGGTQSRALSKERLISNMTAITDFLQAQNADFYLLQEVDENATRSYHLNERQILEWTIVDYDSVYAVNYDSPFLFYPVTQPHGKTLSGIMTFSRPHIASALRRSLPIEKGLRKLLDLDRCYTVSRLPVENGRELALYNIHLSAYTSDGTIADEQLLLLADDMVAECQKGNYVVCGGDFNKDLLGDSSQYFGVSGEDFTWAQPLPAGLLKDLPIRVVASSNAPSCRNADGPYNPSQFVLTLDGFIVSDNVRVLESQVIDTGFTYSDHNPVSLSFALEP